MTFNICLSSYHKSISTMPLDWVPIDNEGGNYHHPGAQCWCNWTLAQQFCCQPIKAGEQCQAWGRSHHLIIIIIIIIIIVTIIQPSRPLSSTSLPILFNIIRDFNSWSRMIWLLLLSSSDISYLWQRVMMKRKTWLVEGNNPVTKTQRPLAVGAGGPHPSIWSSQSSWLYHNQQWHENKDTHTKTENKDTETKTVPRCQAPAYHHPEI